MFASIYLTCSRTDPSETGTIRGKVEGRSRRNASGTRRQCPSDRKGAVTLTD